MPEGWLYDWKGMATMGRQKPRDTFRVESSLHVYLCVPSPSLIDARKAVPMPIRG